MKKIVAIVVMMVVVMTMGVVYADCESNEMNWFESAWCGVKEFGKNVGTKATDVANVVADKAVEGATFVANSTCDIYNTVKDGVVDGANWVADGATYIVKVSANGIAIAWKASLDWEMRGLCKVVNWEYRAIDNMNVWANN